MDPDPAWGAGNRARSGDIGMGGSRILSGLIGLVVLAWPASPASALAGPIDRDAWARKLAGLTADDWRTAFGVGQELAALPGDEGFAILRGNWARVGTPGARQQLLKAWSRAMPYPLKLREHPRLLDGLDLGMQDPAPEVRAWASGFVGDLAFRDFAADLPAYDAWFRAHRDLPLPEVAARSIRAYAAEAARTVKSRAMLRARWVAEHDHALRQIPEARRSALDAGLPITLERWAAGADDGSSPDEIRLAVDALRILGRIGPGEAELRRVAVPLIAKTRPLPVRTAALAVLEGPENRWARDLLLDQLRAALADAPKRDDAACWGAASTLASFEDPAAIPPLIGLIEADNTQDTIYGIGYYGLGRLAGVAFEKEHDGPWWRRWWEANRAKYPDAVRSIEIPRFGGLEALGKALRMEDRDPEPEDPLADVAEIRAGVAWLDEQARPK